MKNDRSGEFEKISTLNVKSSRSDKCEKKFYAKCEKKFGQLDDQSDGQFGQFGQPGQFCSAFSGFGVSTFQKVKNPGKCHDLERKCKIWIQEWTSWHFLVVLYVTNKGGIFGVYGISYRGMCVSRQNDTLSSRINTHQRFPSNVTGYPWAASPHAVRTQVDDHCRKVQWPRQRCAKVTAANRQTMVFKLDNHCTRWMHWVVSNH